MNTLLILNLFIVFGGEGGSLGSVLLKLQELGGGLCTGIPPALHFNTVVICRHHYSMKHTAVQEEQEAGFGNEGSAGNLATMSSGISLTQSSRPSFLCPPPAQPPVTIQNDHFNYTNNQAEKLQYKSCPLTQLYQVYFYKPRNQSDQTCKIK